MERQQLGGERPEPAGVALGPTGFEHIIAPLDETELAQARFKQLHGQLARSRIRGAAAKDRDHRNWPLRQRRQRPCGSRGTKKRDEIAPSHLAPRLAGRLETYHIAPHRAWPKSRSEWEDAARLGWQHLGA